MNIAHHMCESKSAPTLKRHLTASAKWNGSLREKSQILFHIHLKRHYKQVIKVKAAHFASSVLLVAISMWIRVLGAVCVCVTCYSTSISVFCIRQ